MLHVNPPSIPLPADILAIIYDVDNCIAPLSNNDITDAWDIFFAEKFGLPLEEATRLRREYYVGPLGCSAKGYYAAFAESHNLTDDFVDSVYADSAHTSAASFLKRHPLSARLTQLFGIIHRMGIAQMVITQGHPNHYLPIVSHLGVAPYLLHRIDRTSPVYEKLEAEVWKLALDLLGIPPHLVMVLEDTPRNLVQPALLGMRTVLIGDRQIPDDMDPSLIHYRFATAEEALEQLTAVRA